MKAEELPAGQRVFAALLALGALPDKRMKDECSDWHGARHTGVAPGDHESLEGRLSVLRSMLVLARWIGYSGPTLGHVRQGGPQGPIGALSAAVARVETDAEQRAEAATRYVG